MWERFNSPRPQSAAGGFQHVKPECSPTVSTTDEEIILLNDALEQNMCASRMTSRYRFRDLLLGDFAFNDDGER